MSAGEHSAWSPDVLFRLGLCLEYVAPPNDAL
jgi:hypothetical protein